MTATWTAAVPGARRRASSSRTAAPGVLLGAQLVFNVGFYAVVPFLAVVLADDFGLSGAAVGLVLGVRTFAQQGLFLVGGTLADRFGARAIVLTGCAVRVAGYVALAVSTGVLAERSSLGLFVVGTILTGLGGALFSPALETLVAASEAARPASVDRHRPTLFAVLTVVGETGAAIGPVVGAALLGWGFAATAGIGAAVFVGVGLLLAALLPRRAPGKRAPDSSPAASVSATATPPRPATATRPATPPAATSWPSLRHPSFVAFAAVCGVGLLVHAQLYLGLPAELRRVGAAPASLAGLFVVVSVLTVTAQLPLARLAGRLGAPHALRLGFGVLAVGAVVLAVGAASPVLPDAPLAPALVAVVVLTVGHLLVGPVVLGLVPVFAGARPLGSWYGLLASCGGVAVLLGNVGLGALYPLAETTAPSAALPWLALAAVAVVPALVAPRLAACAAPTRAASTHAAPTHAAPTHAASARAASPLAETGRDVPDRPGRAS
ncbi:MFS transporter [Frigoribacterium sp. 2-23]|uniref:MFS transporter n=1 Tax=Frigoribacterium sp. 2-23 TaxID=3415006 RepID=UPI003C701D69